MKTHSLQRINSVDTAAVALRKLLPGQESPWLLLAPLGDAIAYFNVMDGKGLHDGIECPAVSADISGRHYYEDAAVISVLESLQKIVGGEIIREWKNVSLPS